jgi:streptomycin 6-kinase
LVLAGRRGDEEVVLRTPITPWEIEASLPALLAFAGRGGIEILASDAASGTTLMPRLRPGHTMAEATEDEAVDAAGELMLRMRGAIGKGPSVADYLQPTLVASPLPSSLRPDLAKDAARLTRFLLDSSPTPSMLHGDLHHFNVLRHGDEWVAIDPEGMVGDPAYECAAFLRNPVPELANDPALVDRLRQRVLRFSEVLGDPPGRIWGWGIVRTVQTVSWSDVSPFHAPWTKIVAALDELWPEFAPSL